MKEAETCTEHGEPTFAIAELAGPEEIARVFAGFQKYLDRGAA
jgi:hypothetical protein